MAAPEYRANQGTPEAAPKGTASKLNKAMDEVQDVDLSRVEEPVEFPVDEGDVPDSFTYDGDITGLDHQVFGPTKRPMEPVSSGAPWGSGPNTVEGVPAKDFKADIAQRLLATPGVSSRVKNLAARMLREG